MTNLMRLTPPRFGPGPVDGPTLERAFSVIYRDVLARLDPRYPSNDFRDGLVADDHGTVTLGSKALPAGRAVSVPTLTQQISDIGAAKDSRFLPQCSTGNKNSVQDILPLTATADPTTAQISIAAHTLQYGWGKVNYSAGTITGLDPNTLHYVYADDPTFQGGPVSYFAATTPQTVTAANGRYYVGSIVTAVTSTSHLIAAASSTNPIQFTTTTDHGWASNDAVVVDELPGDFAVLNGHSYAITVNGLTTFTIGVDGTGFAAYSAGGTATRESPSTSGGGGGGGGGGHLGGQLP